MNNTINYKKVLEKLTKYKPYELNIIITDSKEAKHPFIELKDIIESCICTTDEKIELLKFFNYNAWRFI